MTGYRKTFGEITVALLSNIEDPVNRLSACRGVIDAVFFTVMATYKDSLVAYNLIESQLRSMRDHPATEQALEDLSK